MGTREAETENTGDEVEVDVALRQSAERGIRMQCITTGGGSKVDVQILRWQTNHDPNYTWGVSTLSQVTRRLPFHDLSLMWYDWAFEPLCLVTICLVYVPLTQDSKQTKETNTYSLGFVEVESKCWR
jgi:hypothetical protein